MGKPVKIALAGEGGQGVQLVAELLAEAAHQEGKEAIYIPNFGVEQRGGVSIAYVQIADEYIGAPRFKKADIVVALCDRAITRTQVHVGPETVLVYDNSDHTTSGPRDNIVGQQFNHHETDSMLIDVQANMIGVVDNHEKPNLPKNAKAVIGIAATEVAKTELTARVFNMIILGAVLKATGVLDLEPIKKALEKKIGDKFEKSPELRDLNYKALTRGMELVDRVL